MSLKVKETVQEPSLKGRLWSHHRGQEEVEPFKMAIYLCSVGLSPPTGDSSA